MPIFSRSVSGNAGTGRLFAFPPLHTSPPSINLPAGKKSYLPAVYIDPQISTKNESEAKTMNIGIDHGYYAIKTRHTPTAVIAPCLTRRESGSLTMPEKPIPKPCPTLNCSAEDFLARLSALPATDEGSEIPAALSSSSWPDWLKPGSLAIYCLKMYLMCRSA